MHITIELLLQVFSPKCCQISFLKHNGWGVSTRVVLGAGIGVGNSFHDTYMRMHLGAKEVESSESARWDRVYHLQLNRSPSHNR